MLGRFCFFALLGIVGFPVFTTPAWAQGVVTITPQLIEFEEQDRTATVLLINRGNEPALYRIQVVNRRMDADGRLEPADKEGPDNQFASPYLRYAPRQLMLPPGEPQTVRILARVPNDLPDGEYRSHLLVQQVPVDTGEADPVEVQDGLVFDLRPVFGTTIPIFIRRGELAAHGKLEVQSVERSADGSSVVNLKILREGNRHLRGNLRVTDGNGTLLRHINNIAVYTTTPHRNLSIRLDSPESLRADQITVELLHRDDEAVMATVTAVVPSG